MLRPLLPAAGVVVLGAVLMWPSLDAASRAGVAAAMGLALASVLISIGSARRTERRMRRNEEMLVRLREVGFDAFVEEQSASHHDGHETKERRSDSDAA